MICWAATELHMHIDGIDDGQSCFLLIAQPTGEHLIIVRLEVTLLFKVTYSIFNFFGISDVTSMPDKLPEKGLSKSRGLYVSTVVPFRMIALVSKQEESSTTTNSVPINKQATEMSLPNSECMLKSKTVFIMCYL